MATDKKAGKKTTAKKTTEKKKSDKKSTKASKPLVLKKQTVADLKTLLRYAQTRQSSEVCVV